MNSAIYKGKIRHRRFSPRPHDFTYSITLFYLDLSEIDDIFNIPFFLGKKAFSFLSFNRKKYFGNENSSLDKSIRTLLKDQFNEWPTGPIRLLTQISYFGFCFNPASFYYCFDESGQRVEYIVADITNTPWRERYAYALKCEGKQNLESFALAKKFHVSPFIPMNIDYVWKFSPPRETLSVHMENRLAGQIDLLFDATLNLKKFPLSQRSVLAVILEKPLLTFKAAIMIYFQALQLWLKRMPFYAHPATKEKI